MGASSTNPAFLPAVISPRQEAQPTIFKNQNAITSPRSQLSVYSGVSENRLKRQDSQVTGFNDKLRDIRQKYSQHSRSGGSLHSQGSRSNVSPLSRTLTSFV